MFGCRSMAVHRRLPGASQESIQLALATTVNKPQRDLHISDCHVRLPKAWQELARNVSEKLTSLLSGFVHTLTSQGFSSAATSRNPLT